MMEKFPLKKVILYSFIVFSVGCNVLVFSIDTLPFLYSRLEQKKELSGKRKRDNVEYENLEKKIVSRSMEMVGSRNVTMVWDDQTGVTKTIASWLSRDRKGEFKIFNYPRAFLYYGLIEYFISKNDKKNLDKVKQRFDVLIGDNGQPTFMLDKVDQVPFGNAALRLYDVYKEQKYKLFCEYFYKYLKDSRNEDGIILYRRNAGSQLNDVLGMVVPFLVDYYKSTSDSTALSIAKEQLDFFIQYGVDQVTSIPSHGVSLSHLTKVGSANWGRGIGWYLLGLSALQGALKDYEDELFACYTSLSSLKLENNLYSQYPGSSDYFDASTSALFLYSFNFLEDERVTKKDILDVFDPYVNEDGSIMGTSGDTYGLNNYSHSFGKSELTQGILLLLLTDKGK